jgi:hypothetical protein
MINILKQYFVFFIPDCFRMLFPPECPLFRCVPAPGGKLPQHSQFFPFSLHFGRATVPVLVISTMLMDFSVSRKIFTRSGVSHI